MFSFAQLKRMYHASPLWVQKVYSSIPFDWRAGKVYRETRALIDETDFLSAAQLQDRQIEKLQALFVHCQQHVPVWRDVMSRINFNPNTDDILQGLERLPLIGQVDLAANPDGFRATHTYGEPVYKDNTGGSSGTPMAFFKNNSMYPRELAYMLAQWERIGYHPRHAKLTLRGRTFSGLDTDKRWSFNPIYNEIALSTYHLNAFTLAESMEQVRRVQPQFIHGYPSAIVVFLQVLLDSGIPLPEGIHAVLCGSEPLYDHQRQFITDTLGCRCYSWYGQSECVILAGECEHSQHYHSFPLYGVMELVDENDQVIRQPNVEGEIVGTSLNNIAMPFVRYRTGDRGILADGECACGRQHSRLKRVTGRNQYFIYTRDMTPVPSTAFVFGQHFDAFERIRGMQLVQDEPGEVLVRIIRDDQFSENDECEIRDKMRQSVDSQLDVRFEYRRELPVNNGGKVEFVIQNVQNPTSIQISSTSE